MLQAKATYNRSKPAGIILSDSETSCDVDNIYDETKDKYPTLLRYICDAKSNEITLYVWAKYESPSDNAIIVSGCMFQTE